MAYSLAIELPGLPRMVNDLGRCHWGVKTKHNRYWDIVIRAQILKDHKFPDLPLPKAQVTLTRFSSAEPDFDNLANSFKCCMDSLVKCGVLSDDNPKVIGQPTYVWEKCSPGGGKIKIEVKSVED